MDNPEHMFLAVPFICSAATSNICSWKSFFLPPPNPEHMFLDAPPPSSRGSSTQLADPARPAYSQLFSSSRRFVKYLTAAVNSSRRGEANNCSEANICSMNICSVGITWVIYYEIVKQHVCDHVLINK